MNGGALNHRTGTQGKVTRYLFSDGQLKGYSEPNSFIDPIFGRPYFYGQESGQLVKFHTLHMAGAH
mgnify:CR=1 FL=1